MFIKIRHQELNAEAEVSEEAFSLIYSRSGWERVPEGSPPPPTVPGDRGPHYRKVSTPAPEPVRTPRRRPEPVPVEEPTLSGEE